VIRVFDLCVGPHDRATVMGVVVHRVGSESLTGTTRYIWEE